jgi:ribosomal subunit interface protein
MDIRVSGHQVEVGAAFKTLAQTRMQGIADKHFARAVSANVTLGHGPHDNGFICDIFMPVTQGLVLKGSGRSPQEANFAFEQAADKIEKQLRRYMRRLKDRHGPGAKNGAASNGEDFEFNAGYTVFRADEEEEAADNPVVVAETRADVPTASVSDAVMMLDLRNTGALLFKNGQTGVLNMVYRREDGNIGWVEPAKA